MAAVLMTNPGLHLAVLGNPKIKRNKRKKASAKKRRQKVRRKSKATSRSNPMAKTRRNMGYKHRKANGQFKKGYGKKTRKNMGYGKKTRKNMGYGKKTRKNMKRRSYRRNPTIAARGRNYVTGLTGAPGRAMKLFRGKNAVKNALYTAGGAAGAYWIGGVVSSYLRPVLGRIPGMDAPIAQRAIGALMPYTGAFLATSFIKNGQIKTSLRLGGAIASIVEFIKPGMVADLIRRVPGGEMIASPVEGLWGIGSYVEAPGYSGTAGYVDAPSYAGTGEYVDAPSYAGTGEDVMLAGYVEDSGYRGAGQEMLAGNFMEESSLFQPMI